MCLLLCCADDGSRPSNVIRGRAVHAVDGLQVLDQRLAGAGALELLLVVAQQHLPGVVRVPALCKGMRCQSACLFTAGSPWNLSTQAPTILCNTQR